MSDHMNLRALAQLTGAPYLAFRNPLIQRGGDYAAAVAATEDDPDWRVPMAARILQGWSSHGDMYRKVTAEIDSIDVAARAPTVAGVSGIWDAYELRAHEEYGPAILPLAWEEVTKFAAERQVWRTATFLSMLSVGQRPESIAAAAHVIEPSDNKLLRDRAALALSKLPRAGVEARFDKLLACYQKEARRPSRWNGVWTPTKRTL